MGGSGGPGRSQITPLIRMRRKGVIGPKGGLRRNPIAWPSQPPDIMDTVGSPPVSSCGASVADKVMKLTPNAGFVLTLRGVVRLP
jgi:hypothetical protein